MTAKSGLSSYVTWGVYRGEISSALRRGVVAEGWSLEGRMEDDRHLGMQALPALQRIFLLDRSRAAKGLRGREHG